MFTSRVWTIPMHAVMHTKLSEGRRLALPAALCREYGLEPGAPVVLEAAEAGIIVRPLEAVLREVQSFFAAAAPPEVQLSEALLQDRRAEAAREDRG